MSDVKNYNGSDGSLGSPSFPSIAAMLRTLPRSPRSSRASMRGGSPTSKDLEWFGVAGGTVLFHQGDPAEDTYIVVTGRFGVFVDAGIGTRMIAQIGPGELVGEMSLLTGEPRSATVVALRDSEVVRIPSHRLSG